MCEEVVKKAAAKAAFRMLFLRECLSGGSGGDR